MYVISTRSKKSKRLVQPIYSYLRKTGFNIGMVLATILVPSNIEFIRNNYEMLEIIERRTATFLLSDKTRFKYGMIPATKLAPSSIGFVLCDMTRELCQTIIL